MDETGAPPDLLAAAVWQCLRTPPDAHAVPGTLATAAGWIDAVVPGTVAQLLYPDPVDGLLPDAQLDAFDWWYRVRLASDSVPPAGRALLILEGLATFAEVWLGNERVLVSDNMFRRHVINIYAGSSGIEVFIVFRALAPRLQEKRPRPRWRTALVAQQNLRWFRTTLLGRIPAWTPPLPPVGPWRPVRLHAVAPVVAREVAVRTAFDGTDGSVQLRAQMDVAAGATIEGAWLELGDVRYPLQLRESGGHVVVDATVNLASPAPWWPHTHGTPELHHWALCVDVGGAVHRVASGRLGFRQLELDRSAGELRLQVNRVPVFCRGACWTTADIRSLAGDRARLLPLLEQARDAGMNMIRVGGTMVYESDAFYSLCDELGILVWQDFMFANMDYPFDDPAFAENARIEAGQQLARLAAHACVAVYCGGSEIEQQAAMLGVPREFWRHSFLAETLPAMCEAAHPGVPYFPSTPCEGALPFHTSEGLTHYFGVGAYQRDFSDLHAAKVRFAPECIGLSNVPVEASVVACMSSATPQTHHPRWKAGVPRDAGSGWDFEDIRDFYLKALFGVDAVALRYADTERYLALSRVVSGEVLARAFSFWRAAGSGCGGALVWTLSDIVPGAGWGLIDSGGAAKPALWILKQHLQPVQVLLLDGGLNGHRVSVINETPEPLEARLLVELWQPAGTPVAVGDRILGLDARSTIEISVDELFGRFLDTTRAYRFGPAQHCLLSATLLDAQGRVISQVCLDTSGKEPPVVRGVSLAVRVEAREGGEVLTMRSDALLRYVTIDMPGYALASNVFCMLPGRDYVVPVRRFGAEGAIRGHVSALNTLQTFRIQSSANV